MTAPNTPALRPEDVEILTARAIPVEFALRAGLRSVDLREVAHFKTKYGLEEYRGLPCPPIAGILIPYQQCVDNTPRCRVRSGVKEYVQPGPVEGAHHGEQTVKVPRYLCQAGVAVVPYMTRAVLEIADDVTTPIYVVEAPLKALSLSAHGMPAIGLGGVVAGAHDTEVRDRLGEIVASEELRRILWRGRTAYVVFDAGITDNPMVALGAAFVAHALAREGADVRFVTLPYFHPQDSDPLGKGTVWRPEDQGPDDFIAREGVEALRQLVGRAIVGDPVTRVTEVVGGQKGSARAQAVARLLQELPFQAILHAGGAVAIDSVAAVTKIAGIGKRSLGQAVRQFRSRLARRGSTQGDGPAAKDTRIEIRLGVDTDRMVLEAITALANDKDIYARGDALVRVLDGRGGPEAKAIKPSVLRVVHLARSASWVSVDPTTREQVPVKPPPDVAQAVHDHQEWPGVRNLIGIVNTPVMRPDGSLLDTAGFDPATGLLLLPSCEVGRVPETPTSSEIADAKALLLDVIADFPLVPSGEACWLSLVLSYFARPMFAGPGPGFVIDANTRSSGKGLLADVTGRICYGRPLPITNPTEDQEELRKRITATLIKGRGMVLVDNLPTNGEFGNATWDRLLTSTVWEDRVLGVSDTVVCPNNAIWVFTANNVLVVGDTVRRVLHIRLESPLEAPEKRDPSEFVHADLRAWVTEHRAELVRAALILLRAWVVAGKPPGHGRLGSFEGWAATVAACVEWHGLGDVTATQEEYSKRISSGDAGPVKRLMAAWKEEFGSNEQRAADVVRLIRDEDERVRAEKRRRERAPSSMGADGASIGTDSDAVVHLHQELRDAIVEFCESRSDKVPTASWLGRHLQGASLRVVGGLRFEARVDRHDVSFWRLVPLTDAASEGAMSAAGSSAGSCRGTAGSFPENGPAHVSEFFQEVEPSADSAGSSSSSSRFPTSEICDGRLPEAALISERPLTEGTEMSRLNRRHGESRRNPAVEGAGSTFQNEPADDPAHDPAAAWNEGRAPRWRDCTPEEHAERSRIIEML